MTSEEVVICSHVFVAYCIILVLQLHHTVHKQEWKTADQSGIVGFGDSICIGIHSKETTRDKVVPMWKDLLYLLNIFQCFIVIARLFGHHNLIGRLGFTILLIPSRPVDIVLSKNSREQLCLVGIMLNWPTWSL